MNDNKNLSQNQIDALISEASKASGIDKGTMQDAAKTGKLDKVLSNLNPAQAQKLQQILGDKQATKEFLSSPQAQKLLVKILGDKK